MDISRKFYRRAELVLLIGCLAWWGGQLYLRLTALPR